MIKFSKWRETFQGHLTVANSNNAYNMTTFLCNWSVNNHTTRKSQTCNIPYSAKLKKKPIFKTALSQKGTDMFPDAPMLSLLLVLGTLAN